MINYFGDGAMKKPSDWGFGIGLISCSFLLFWSIEKRRYWCLLVFVWCFYLKPYLRSYLKSYLKKVVEFLLESCRKGCDEGDQYKKTLTNCWMSAFLMVQLKLWSYEAVNLESWVKCGQLSIAFTLMSELFSCLFSKSFMVIKNNFHLIGWSHNNWHTLV